MMMRPQSWLALFVALLLLACGPGEPAEELPDAEMPEVEAFPEAEPADPIPDPMAALIEQAFSITNNTPHVMVVSVVEDGEAREIARVDPEATDSLVVEGAPGEEITLIATDEDETLTVDFTIEVGAMEPPTWTIDSDS